MIMDITISEELLYCNAECYLITFPKGNGYSMLHFPPLKVGNFLDSFWLSYKLSTFQKVTVVYFKTKVGANSFLSEWISTAKGGKTVLKELSPLSMHLLPLGSWLLLKEAAHAASFGNNQLQK